MPGHVFVMRGDLTRLACEAILIPMDAQLNVTQGWLSLLPPDRVTPSNNGWHRLLIDQPPGWSDSVRALEVPTAAKPALWLVETGADDPSAQWVADGIREGLRRAAAHLRQAGDARAKPLIGLSLAGTGAGGLRTRRGQVIEALLPTLREAAQEEDVDVVLVLANDRDHAAVQARRSPEDWPELDGERDTADELGGRLARGEVSLFLGAGVSVPLGLPDWGRLVDQLRSHAGLPPAVTAQGASAEVLQDQAEEAARKLGPDRVGMIIADLFKADRHTLAHGLLAGLRVPHVVTTNYDDAYELAAEGVFDESGRPKVLTRGVAEAGRPWLLKLHGDVHKPETVVLTRSQYADFDRSCVPLRGMVQSLLMTGHLVFVGYSLVDSTFAALAEQVRAVLKQSTEQRGFVGTVLPIQPDPAIRERCGDDLAYVPMPAREVPEGGRLLEIFLDRMCWRAVEQSATAMQYLLDPHYAAVTREPEDEALQRALLQLLEDAPPSARRSAGWSQVAEALRRLGADDAVLQPRK